jgi:3-oxoacyl-[acyl-carrier-protein] synthase II
MNRDSSLVAVTGIGLISPLGSDLDAFRDGLLECRSCLEALDIFESGLDSPPVVGQIRRPLTVEELPGFRFSRTDRLGIIAARDALAEVGKECSDCRESGVVIATTVAGLGEIEPRIIADPRSYYRHGGFSTVTSYQSSHVADAVGAYFGLRGPRYGVNVACASGAIAIALGAKMVLDGTAPMALAGGSEALCPFTLSGFSALQTLDPGPCRPFDKNRKGLNLGEGAAILVLETLERARARQARIWAVLRGWGMTNDAFHLTAPDEQGRGLAESITLAMQMAGVGPDEIGYVNAHGTGTDLNDAAEVRAYEAAFRNRRHPIPVSSSKSYFGHCLGAAGALEAVVTILSVRSGVLFPTLRLNDPIESSAVDWLMGEPRRQRVPLAMTASAGFGGSNTSLVFGLDGGSDRV